MGDVCELRRELFRKLKDFVEIFYSNSMAIPKDETQTVICNKLQINDLERNVIDEYSQRTFWSLLNYFRRH